MAENKTEWTYVPLKTSFNSRSLWFCTRSQENWVFEPTCSVHLIMDVEQFEIPSSVGLQPIRCLEISLVCMHGWCLPSMPSHLWNENKMSDRSLSLSMFFVQWSVRFFQAHLDVKSKKSYCSIYLPGSMCSFAQFCRWGNFDRVLFE